MGVTSLRGRTGNSRAQELIPYSSWTAPGDPRDARPPSEAGRLSMQPIDHRGVVEEAGVYLPTISTVD